MRPSRALPVGFKQPRLPAAATQGAAASDGGATVVIVVLPAASPGAVTVTVMLPGVAVPWTTARARPLKAARAHTPP